MCIPSMPVQIYVCVHIFYACASPRRCASTPVTITNPLRSRIAAELLRLLRILFKLAGDRRVNHCPLRKSYVWVKSLHFSQFFPKFVH